MYIDYVYEIVKDESYRFEAIYEDFIIHLVGITGFKSLRKARLLEACGSVNGRNLYTLNEKKF